VNNVLTCGELAKRLKCSKSHVSKLINGKVKGVPPLKTARIGRRPLVIEATLEQWLRDREAQPCNGDR
jgi:excisionase family DNA binding protein